MYTHLYRKGSLSGGDGGRRAGIRLTNSDTLVQRDQEDESRQQQQQQHRDPKDDFVEEEKEEQLDRGIHIQQKRRRGDKRQRELDS